MRRRSPTAIVCSRGLPVAFALVVLACAPDAPRDTRVAIAYGDEALTLDAFEAELARRPPVRFSPARRDSVLLAYAESLVDKLVMAHEARRVVRGDTTGLAAVLDRIERDTLLDLYRGALLDTILVDDAALARVLDLLGEEVRVRHVLTERLEEAEDVRRALETGAAFEELVAARSQDAFTRESGGLLDWIDYGNFPRLDEAAFRLDVGGLAGPVWSKRGWHVIEVVDRRARVRSDLAPAETVRLQETARLRERTWSEHLARLAASRGLERHDAGLVTMLRLIEDHGRSFARYRRDHARATKDGVAPGDLPLPPEIEAPGPEAAAEPVATARGFRFTVGDATGAFARASPDERPESVHAPVVRAWLMGRAREALVLDEARRSGFADRVDVALEVRNAREFELVRRLYDEEVRNTVTPSEDDVRAFYEVHADAYSWRPDLDLAVVRTKDRALIVAVIDSLLAGRSVDTFSEDFREDTTLVAYRTGPKRTFPEVPGLTELARELGDVVGAVSQQQVLDGMTTVVRIEAVGESEPMSLADAYEIVFQSCLAEMRERKLRALLDSLRATLTVTVNRDVVLAATIPRDPS